jgi:hypothetical protein
MMLERKMVSYVGAGFILGMVAPFIISIIFMWVSESTASILLRVFVPFSFVRGIPEGWISGLNGCLYAFLAFALWFMFRR